MLWQISDHALFKKDLIYFRKLLGFQTSVKNKNNIYHGFSNILQEDCSFLRLILMS